MSALVQGGDYDFTVGGSRVGDLPSGMRGALIDPGAAPCLKQEDRTLIWRVPLALPGREEHAIVKLYRRRGVLNRLRGGALPFRVQREFDALCVLADGGAPCSQPLVWGWGFAPQHGAFELLVTREIQGAVSLKAYLGAGERRLGSDDFLALFRVLRCLHERGVYHGALWPKNILLTKAADGGCEFHLVDLARAVRFRGTICGTAMARFDLLSLLYSLARTEPGLDSEAVLRGYGYKATEARQIAAQARRYRSSRHLRNRLALTFQLRALLDCR